MPLSTDINLPKNHTPRFPDRCVVCGKESPDSNIRLMTTSIGWWSVLFWFFGKPFSVRAPSCAGCRWRLHGLRVGSWIITILVATLIGLFGWPLLSDHIPPKLRKWILMGAVLLALTPLLLYEVFWPNPFCITAYEDSVDYEFRDEDYAVEFASLNRNAKWIKVDSVDISEDLDIEESKNHYNTMVLVEYYSQNIQRFISTPFEKLSYPEKVFFSVWELETDVNNGGFSQYYFNSSGDTAFFVENALKEIGAHETCEIVHKANSIFENGTPPTDVDFRRRLMESVDDTTEKFLDDLNSDFFEYPDDLTDLLFRYVSNNSASFLGWDSIVLESMPDQP